MNDFIAIDFETANGCRSSVCSVGVVMVRNGEIADDLPDGFKREFHYFTTMKSRAFTVFPSYSIGLSVKLPTMRTPSAYSAISRPSSRTS